MLDSLRSNKRNIIISFLFLIIIAVFILNFGPQSGSGGCKGASKDHVLSVNDHAVSEASWRFAVNTLERRGAAEKPIAMELLLRREILAQAAEAAGFRIATSAVDDVIKSGSFYVLGQKQVAGSPLHRAYFTDYSDDGFDDPVFDGKKLERMIGNWGLSLTQFREQQRREMLADAWAHAISGSALASRDEAQAAFQLAGTQVELDVVRFRPAQYASALELGDADLDGYIAANQAKVKAQYDADLERDYKGRKAEVKVRKIFVARTVKAAVPAPEPGKPAEPSAKPVEGGADATPPSSAAPAPGAPAVPPATPAADRPEDDEAYKKLAAARDQIATGKTTFAAVARELSEDLSKPKGGLIGWRKLEAPTLGATEANDALKTLAENKVSDVIVSKSGFYLLMVEGKREGDLTFDQVKREIADKMARDYYAEENARREALAAFTRAKESGKNLEDLFTREEKPQRPRQLDQEQIQQLLKAGMSPEQIEQLLQGQLGPESGALTWESPDVPAAWSGWQEPSAGGMPAPGPAAIRPPDPAPDAKKPPTTAESPAVPAARRPTTTADKAPAAEGMKPPVPAASPTPVPAAGAPEGGAAAAGPDDVMRIATDPIPAPATPVEVKVLRLGPFSRDRDTIEGLGKSPELIRAAFDVLAAGQLAPRVYKVGSEYVVAQLMNRTEADLDEFIKLEAEEIDTLAQERGRKALAEWVIERCTKLLASKAISPNLRLLQQSDEAGNPMPVSYTPCEMLKSARTGI